LTKRMKLLRHLGWLCKITGVALGVTINFRIVYKST